MTCESGVWCLGTGEEPSGTKTTPPRHHYLNSLRGWLGTNSLCGAPCGVPGLTRCSTGSSEPLQGRDGRFTPLFG